MEIVKSRHWFTMLHTCMKERRSKKNIKTSLKRARNFPKFVRGTWPKPLIFYKDVFEEVDKAESKEYSIAQEDYKEMQSHRWKARELDIAEDVVITDYENWGGGEPGGGDKLSPTGPTYDTPAAMPRSSSGPGRGSHFRSVALLIKHLLTPITPRKLRGSG